MSADNWAVCPRCAKRRAAHIESERAKLDGSYGKLPLPEFDAMRATFLALEAEKPQYTFREDYEFYGIEDGELHISYQGSCKVCGLGLTVDEVRPLDMSA